jgi:hypothetical protein
MTEDNFYLLKNKTKPYLILAAFLDFNFIVLYLGFFFALLSYFYKIIFNYYLALICLPLVLISIILYYSKITMKTHFLSPGELICGRKLINKVKVWQTPYKISRLGIFLLFFINIISLSNIWDPLISAANNSLFLVIETLLIILVITLGFCYTGLGKLEALLLPATSYAYLFLKDIVWVKNYSPANHYFFGGLSLVYLIMFLCYKLLLDRITI